jgi:two-component sensor histidine kinase
MVQFFNDVTERRIAEIRQTELVEEINRREKNLSMVSAVLRMQARNDLVAVHGAA